MTDKNPSTDSASMEDDHADVDGAPEQAVGAATAGGVAGEDPGTAEAGRQNPSDPAPASAAEVDAVERELTEELERERETEVVPPDVELQALRGELEVLQDRHLRTVAEYDNYRKRTAQELRSAWTRAQADLIGSFLEALDDLQRVGTWEESTTDLAALIEGVDLVERKFSQALSRAGVEAFDPLGEVFDPNTMEAMMKVAPEEEDQEDHVAEVFQKGYLIEGTLVRPARVGVYKSD